MAIKKVKPRTSKGAGAQTYIGLCRECALCTPKMDFHLLSLKGEPTVGTCPEAEHSVLLSQQGCNHWKNKN